MKEHFKSKNLTKFLGFALVQRLRNTLSLHANTLLANMAIALELGVLHGHKT